MSDIQDLQKRAREIRDKYDALSRAKGTPAWGPLERTAGFTVDVGELVELVMAKEGLRSVEDVDAKLAHELADCLWSVLCIADYYDVDIEKAFTGTMDQLDTRIARAHEN